jgi:hypothetical protein
MEQETKGPALDTQAHDENVASKVDNDIHNLNAAAPQEGTLKLQFDAALDLLRKRLRLGAAWTEWRKGVKEDGLDANVLIKLAREYLRNAEERRKAFETAEIERLYRQGLDLPLLAWGEEADQ